ncbi:MAG: archease [Candidatus Micrarchaeia archaeon]|jgi:SHS2 domain-containing protein
MQYRFLEHTADIMFEAYGKSYEEALENSAHAMFSVFGEAGESEHATFSVTAHNIEELTVQTLADMLAYMDTGELIFSRAKVLSYDAKKHALEIEAFGEKKQPRDTVKAVTYHELMVAHDKKGWTIRILLDV